MGGGTIHAPICNRNPGCRLSCDFEAFSALSLWPSASCGIRNLWHIRGGGTGAKPDAVSQAIGNRAFGSAWNLRPDAASALHFGLLCRPRLVTRMGKLVGVCRFFDAGNILRRQSPTRRTVAAAAIPGLHELRATRAAIHSLDLLTFRLALTLAIHYHSIIEHGSDED